MKIPNLLAILTIPSVRLASISMLLLLMALGLTGSTFLPLMISNHPHPAHSVLQDETPAIPEFEGTIIDDLSDGFILLGPDKYWHEEHLGYLDHSWWTRNNASKVENSVRWYLPISEPGTYNLFVYIPFSHASTRQANYHISYGSQSATIQVDQFSHRNSWYSLGSFTFEIPDDIFIELTDQTGEEDAQFEIGIDAVGFTRKPAGIEEQITDELWGRAQPWLDEQSEKLQGRLEEWLLDQKAKFLSKLADIVTGWIHQQCANMGAAMLLPLFALILWHRGQHRQ